MNAIFQPLALSNLLFVFAEGSYSDRLAVARLGPGTRTFYSDALEASGRLLNAGAETFRAQATIAAVARLTWSLVPARLIDSPSPDIRGLAEKALLSRFGEFDGFDAVSRHLTIVFKRIRQYAREGRRAMSLDLDLIAHQQIFERQNGRCNHCQYEFKGDLYSYAVEEDAVVATRYNPLPGEIALEKTFRRPELDHIVPLILGGDSPQNWQILCKSCNLGKSDQITYIFSLAGQNYNRVEHLFGLTAGKRYAVIAESIFSGVLPTEPLDGKWYRIFKKDKLGLSNPENLVAHYE